MSAAHPGPEPRPHDPTFERARRIADAVLYEGYLLYPYRASARKNRYRWTFGVLVPRAWTTAGGGEPATATLECLLAADQPAPVIEGRLRFLHVERRVVEIAASDGLFTPVESLTVAGQQHLTWEEGLERELPFTLPLGGAEPIVLRRELPGRRDEQPLDEGDRTVGRVVRLQRPLSLRLTARTSAAGDGLRKLTITVENMTPFADPEAPREEAVTAALVSAHLLLAARGASFVSLLDPPAAARTAAAACHSVGLYPVLAGDPGSHGLLLASPIVLYDHPQVAAESPGESCDGTEIDELLTLSTRSLTDEEKREARATDRRAAAIIDRAEQLSNAALLALHGKGHAAPFARGSRVRVRLAAPTGPRRTDAQDMFLDGRVGVVEELREDFDGQTHVAIVLEDDPAAELHRWYGRHWHFRPDELELLEPAP